MMSISAMGHNQKFTIKPAIAKALEDALQILKQLILLLQRKGIEGNVDIVITD
jgi:hypothetical protein